MTAALGRFVVRLGEVERRQSFQDDGATSAAAWTAERFGVSAATARAYVQVGAKAPDIPHLVGSMVAGEVSLDKVRAVAEVATPETDRELCEQATQHSVREMAEVARTVAERAAERAAAQANSARPEQAQGTLRFNDTFGTMTLQLPRLDYAQTKALLEARAKKIPTDGVTPWDERLAEAHMELVQWARAGAQAGAGAGAGAGASGHRGQASPATAGPLKANLVVVHVPLDALVDDDAQATELAAELEHNGLIDVATVQKLSCDATVAVAVDDDVGHTMYEGRARRFPNEAQRREVMRRDRQCRFPGCAAVTFADVHHIVPWKPHGRTDLDNLALLCRHHHGVVHRKGWSMTGNANSELTIVGPTGRVMVSRPSPLWTRGSTGRGSGAGTST
jgi:hypothetical protein